jgi:hypothetical protein
VDITRAAVAVVHIMEERLAQVAQVAVVLELWA